MANEELTRKDFSNTKDYLNYLLEIFEKYDYKPKKGGGTFSKKLTSLRSSKDKKYKGHTSYKT